MLPKKTNAERTPFFICLFRVVHVFFVVYAVAITLVAFGTAKSPLPWFTLEGLYGVAVAAPMFFASFFGFLALTIRALFVPAIFFSFLAALILASLPVMTAVFFPDHIVIFALAAVYLLSSLATVRVYFSLPVVKKR